MLRKFNFFIIHIIFLISKKIVKDPKYLNTAVKGELEHSLLRMAENAVLAENQIEDLQKQLVEKDKII